MDNLKSCIKEAQSKGVKQSDIIKIVGEIYNPMTYSVGKFVSPFVANQANKQLQSFTKTKGGVKKNRKNNKKTKKRH